MSAYEWPSTYGGCAFKPVIGVAKSWPIVCLQVAESVSTPERQEADINRQGRLTDNFKVCTQIWL